MALRWYTVVIDCRDVRAQAHWWAGALDWKVVYEDDDEVVIVPRHVGEEPHVSAESFAQAAPAWVFVPVPEGKTVKNRIHVDLAPHTSQDRDAEIARLLQLGATTVDVGQDRSQVTWEVLADPEGNEFCVLSSRNR